jgi:hypothetical protein
MAALQQLLDALRAARASREVSSILLLIGKAVESLLEGLVHGLQVRGCCGHPSFGQLPYPNWFRSVPVSVFSAVDPDPYSDRYGFNGVPGGQKWPTNIKKSY